jgi:hypothetical protein
VIKTILGRFGSKGKFNRRTPRRLPPRFDNPGLEVLKTENLFDPDGVEDYSA